MGYMMRAFVLKNEDEAKEFRDMECFMNEDFDPDNSRTLRTLFKVLDIAHGSTMLDKDDIRDSQIRRVAYVEDEDEWLRYWLKDFLEKCLDKLTSDEERIVIDIS